MALHYRFSGPPRDPNEAFGQSWRRVREMSVLPRFFPYIFIWIPLITLCVWIVATLLPTTKNLLLARQRLFESQQRALMSIPELEGRIAALEERSRLLSTASIDERLKTVERTLRVGDVKADQIASLEDTRKEVEVLKTYMFGDPKGLVELKQLQSDYRLLRDQGNTFATKEELKAQMSSLTNLMFVSLAFFGIIISILLGPKLFARKRAISTTPVAPPTGG